ncbi:GNAT family N-acetyltransferase [Plantactinospora endophytica]|uniref:N-acetyltransferase n=1 Tax=Plantactinospora endophytica TaxID=673535 RepID=A0ABQ4DY37_9ACTN|nr:GNAT family N-acetyltransferase [Plantactinospora endophytica]GIG87357.1 N-acetyltransferase [Plantactinospora endophytica]
MTMRSHRPQPPIQKIDDIEVVEHTYDHPDTVRLLMAFYQEQVDRYGFADPIEADPIEYTHPRGIFVVAYHQGTPAGCGGYRWCEQPTGVIEIKKLYTLSDARGLGIGRIILTSLEQHGFQRGARQAILETGVRNKSAVQLFRSLGYHPTAPYVADRDPDINRAYAKSLISWGMESGPDDLHASIR